METVCVPLTPLLLLLAGGSRAHRLISSYFALQIHPWLLRGRRVFNTCCPGWRDQICSARATNTQRPPVGSLARSPRQQTCRDEMQVRCWIKTPCTRIARHKSVAWRISLSCSLRALDSPCFANKRGGGLWTFPPAEITEQKDGKLLGWSSQPRVATFCATRCLIWLRESVFCFYLKMLNSWSFICF